MNGMAPHSLLCTTSHALEKRHSAPSFTTRCPPMSHHQVLLHPTEETGTDSTATTTTLFKRSYLQEENRNLRQHLLVQHELLYQAEVKKSEALLRILRMQDRRWRKENQTLRDEVARLQYQLQHKQQQQQQQQQQQPSGLQLMECFPDDELEDAPQQQQQQPLPHHRNYQVFQACTEKPLGTVVETEDNRHDELMETPGMVSVVEDLSPAPPTTTNKDIMSPNLKLNDCLVWNPFGEDSIVPSVVDWSFSGTPPARQMMHPPPPPSEPSESNIDLDDYYDCVSLMSLYSASASVRQECGEGEGHHLEETMERHHRHHRGNYGGGKKKRWRTGACWKKLTT